ncbi:MAG: hypothetical protein LBC60_07435 [Spirochaetaceae bacterium]|jgi:hypothetical protein|nr:hypothetical protein [Spirochaetaceae bacterium]
MSSGEFELEYAIVENLKNQLYSCLRFHPTWLRERFQVEGEELRTRAQGRRLKEPAWAEFSLPDARKNEVP